MWRISYKYLTVAIHLRTLPAVFLHIPLCLSYDFVSCFQCVPTLCLCPCWMIMILYYEILCWTNVFVMIKDTTPSAQGVLRLHDCCWIWSLFWFFLALYTFVPFKRRTHILEIMLRTKISLPTRCLLNSPGGGHVAVTHFNQMKQRSKL